MTDSSAEYLRWSQSPALTPQQRQQPVDHIVHGLGSLQIGQASLGSGEHVVVGDLLLLRLRQNIVSRLSLRGRARLERRGRLRSSAEPRTAILCI